MAKRYAVIDIGAVKIKSQIVKVLTNSVIAAIHSVNTLTTPDSTWEVE